MAGRETAHRYIGVNTAVGDGSNDPEAATVECGRAMLEAIVERVAVKAKALLAESTDSTNREAARRERAHEPED